ncbi:porin family protein [Panacibacter ginsenosidivorans]|uniref:Porin family protein n=1 Tax=Panacibacter ginsenosidivorans TaxID=1813871 RepID=A0A5B8VCT9_9BACT|nr:outer membrane beta-barrel protein [Panacibacter ginsenosidivorans]QEC68761.1 porin family protein [Panacibacter ginsenosidivorans]
MKLKFFIVFAVIPVFVFSQSGFKPGFIVKNNGDTVRGFLESIETKKISGRISFSPSNTSNPATFTTAEIKSFGYDGENTFRKVVYTDPFELTQKEQFAKLLSLGYYSLYTFWKKDVMYFIIKTPEDSCHLLYDDDRSSNGYINQKGNFQNELLFFSQSCNTLKPLIETLNYTEADLIQYIQKLNKCVSPSTASQIVYKKEKSKLNIYAYAGGMYFGSGHEYTGRIIGKITVPAVDKNLALTFGLNYMTHQNTELVDVLGYKKEQTVNKNIFSVPLSIQYYFTKGIIRPYLDAGVTLDYLTTDGELTFYGKKINDSKFGPAFTAALGIEGYITQRLFIKADFRYELFVHYPTVGIAYTFK